MEGWGGEERTMGLLKSKEVWEGKGAGFEAGEVERTQI